MARVEGTFETSVDIRGPLKLIVETGSGDIHVTRGQDDRVFVASRFTIQAPSAQRARQLAEKIKNDPPVELVGQTVEIGDLSKYGSDSGIFNWFLGTSIVMDFDIQAPYETEAELDSGSGDQEISSFRGSVSADAGSGDAKINNIEKEVIADTGSGDIQVTGAARARADAGSGDITLKRITGDVDVDVGSGDVSLEKIGGDIQIDSGSGDIEIDSSLGQDACWEVDGSSGDVVIHLPSDANFSLEAETSSGEIEVDFPLMISGKMHQGELRGSVGQNPKAEIHIETSSGDVQIKKK